MKSKFLKCLLTPETVDWEITQRCNLQCIHCNVRRDNKTGELPFKQMMSIVDMLCEDKVFKISVGGGEPLLYPNIYHLLEYLVYKGFSPGLLSNGILLNDTVIEKLEKIGIERIQISLDGASAKTYNSMRGGGKGTFDKILAHAQSISQSSMHLQINTVVTKLNVNEILDILDLSLKIGAKAFRVVSLIPVTKELRALQISNAQLVYLVHLLEKKRNELRDKISIGLPTIKFLHHSGITTLLSRVVDKNSLACEAGTVLCTITPSGDVIPCTYFRSQNFVGGNLTRSSLREIWTHSPVFQRFRELGKLPPECSSCKIKYLCRGGCRAMAFYQLGQLKAVDPRCWFLREEKE